MSCAVRIRIYCVSVSVSVVLCNMDATKRHWFHNHSVWMAVRVWYCKLNNIYIYKLSISAMMTMAMMAVMAVMAAAMVSWECEPIENCCFKYQFIKWMKMRLRYKCDFQMQLQIVIEHVSKGKWNPTNVLYNLKQNSCMTNLNAERVHF